MFGSAILEVAIGIIFVFLLVSIISSAIREGIESRLKSRAAHLERGIRELLHDRSGRGLARRFYEHPLIFSLYADGYTPGSTERKMLPKGGSLPSYIPAGNFAAALMDIAARGSANDAASHASAPVMSLDSIRANITNIENVPVQRVLLHAIDSAQGDLDRARQNIQTWYDSGMDRVSGWYKRSTQWIIFWIALVVAVGLNINTITIADYLYRDNTARAAIVARAEVAAADGSFTAANYEHAKLELQQIRLPIGWSAGWGAPHPGGTGVESAAGGVWNALFGPILGWLLTAFAATMGAPFWFDLLNRMMVVRSTVKPHEKSPEEASEDRQPRRRRVPITPVVVAGNFQE